MSSFLQTSYDVTIHLQSHLRVEHFLFPKIYNISSIERECLRQLYNTVWFHLELYVKLEQYIPLKIICIYVKLTENENEKLIDSIITDLFFADWQQHVRHHCHKHLIKCSLRTSS